MRLRLFSIRPEGTRFSILKFALAAQRRDAGRNQRECLVGERLGRLRPSTLAPLQRCPIDRPADDCGNEIHALAPVRLGAVLQ